MFAIFVSIVTLFAFAGFAPGQPGDAMFRIVSPGYVAEHGQRPDVKVLDVRTAVSDYQHGHVPGAVFIANDVFRAPAQGVPVQYLGPEATAALFERAGINRGDEVIVYADADDVLGATMVAYALHRIGHGDAALMDGGIEAYRTQYPLTQQYPNVGTGDLSAQLDRSIFATYADVLSAIGQEGVFLLDVRPVPDFLGNTNRWMRNGHIPGAVNLDWHHLMRSDNAHEFKDLATMRQLVEATGVKKSDEIILYCGTSREATLMYHVMKHVLGYPDVRLYEGSWTEYCAQPGAEVAHRGKIITPASLSGTDQQHAGMESYSCGDVERIHVFGDSFLASQPKPSDFEIAAKQGIATVINLRYPGETKFDEQRVVEDLGMTYHSVPFESPEDLTADKLTRIRELLSTAQRPVLVHCSSANRTGAAWLAHRAMDTPADFEQALGEARTVGLRTDGYVEVVKSYMQRRSSRDARHGKSGAGWQR